MLTLIFTLLLIDDLDVWLSVCSWLVLLQRLLDDCHLLLSSQVCVDLLGLAVLLVLLLYRLIDARSMVVRIFLGAVSMVEIIFTLVLIILFLSNCALRLLSQRILAVVRFVIPTLRPAWHAILS